MSLWGQAGTITTIGYYRSYRSYQHMKHAVNNHNAYSHAAAVTDDEAMIVTTRKAHLTNTTKIQLNILL